ncbi:DNA repair protein complementing XP-A cells-like [Tropilaelaps mercedesae]|uniref:DNA repair protein complementing XP-A cells-like n=1 Tax=Tropilaelaps mercedesae TaxID=418985 RepID=A0A1V9XZX5_9ACAR|nr:DNA repair protein complementing XP-A cells-like [Tropilaelaps mercedesae]
MESLPLEQRKKIEEKRQQAISRRNVNQTVQIINSTVRVVEKPGGSQSGDGYFYSGEEVAPKKLREVPEDPVKCIECNRMFLESVAREKFNMDLCDECRKSNERYRFVPRTEAKNLFKLKDCDLDSRPPPLPFLSRANPHREHGAPMRLYLFSQLEDRARIVWGSLETLENERAKRKQDANKRRKAGFEKRIKDMRREFRVQSYQPSTGHEHSYGPEQLDPNVEDGFFKECTSCGHRLSYEKM